MCIFFSVTGSMKNPGPDLHPALGSSECPYIQSSSAVLHPGNRLHVRRELVLAFSHTALAAPPTPLVDIRISDRNKHAARSRRNEQFLRSERNYAERTLRLCNTPIGSCACFVLIPVMCLRMTV
jgi:hypothetical protein